MRDTIAAIASGMTASGIGIIRISGPEAFRLPAELFRAGKKVENPDLEKHPNLSVYEWKANTIHYGHLYDGDACIDECLIMAMRAPHTFTGEDTIEINCHGGLFVMQRILSLVLKHNVRSAEPGEFTKRAFLNGRIDLTEAEAVMDVISSQSDDALESSVSQLGGSLKNEITALRSVIMDELAFIEAALDDPEHMSLDGYANELKKKIQPVKQRLSSLISSFQNGKILREGVMTVILGKPNAGKSSLLNVLTGEDRAIVTDIAGTTRDVLEENVTLGGIKLRLLDTAGIRETSDRIEEIGVERAVKYAGQADLILCVIDSSRPLDENDEKILQIMKGKQAVVLLNKSDLHTYVSEDDIKRRTDAAVLSFSAKERTGMDELAETIRGMFFGGDVSLNEQVILTNVRHKEAAERAMHSINLVEESIDMDMPEDFYTIDLMEAYRLLGEIIGESVEEDLVNTIFAKFCMGK